MSRPWRNDDLVEECNQQLIKLDVSQRREIAKVLSRRAQLYVAAHAFQNARLDYTAVLGLQPEDIKTLVNRGLVYKQLSKPEEGLADMETAWRIFSAARERALIEDGKLLQPSTELDIAAHQINSIRFSLRMRAMTHRGGSRAAAASVAASASPPPAKPPAKPPAFGGFGGGGRASPFGGAVAGGGSPGSTPRWAALRKMVRPKKAEGVTLTWLVEWGVRNQVSHKALPFCCAPTAIMSKTVPFCAVRQIPGCGEWLAGCAKGKKLLGQMVEATGYPPAGAARCVRHAMPATSSLSGTDRLQPWIPALHLPCSS
eukprot:SAG22_NODE_461_length_10216_cov_25.124543_2_plen_314_part_00